MEDRTVVAISLSIMALLLIGVVYFTYSSVSNKGMYMSGYM